MSPFMPLRLGLVHPQRPTRNPGTASRARRRTRDSHQTPQTGNRGAYRTAGTPRERKTPRLWWGQREDSCGHVLGARAVTALVVHVDGALADLEWLVAE